MRKPSRANRRFESSSLQRRVGRTLSRNQKSRAELLAERVGFAATLALTRISGGRRKGLFPISGINPEMLITRN